jgi:hypothetical protein
MGTYTKSIEKPNHCKASSSRPEQGGRSFREWSFAPASHCALEEPAPKISAGPQIMFLQLQSLVCGHRTSRCQFKPPETGESRPGAAKYHKNASEETSMPNLKRFTLARLQPLHCQSHEKPHKLYFNTCDGSHYQHLNDCNEIKDLDTSKYRDSTNQFWRLRERRQAARFLIDKSFLELSMLF